MLLIDRNGKKNKFMKSVWQRHTVYVLTLVLHSIQIFSVNFCVKALKVSALGEYVLGDQDVTANIYCKSRSLPNTDTQNVSTDLR